VDLSQLLSLNQSRYSGKLKISQMLHVLRIACSLSKHCHFLHKWTFQQWMNNLPVFITLTTWIFYSVLITYLARSINSASTRLRCKLCNKDSNSSNNNKWWPNNKTNRELCSNSSNSNKSLNNHQRNNKHEYKSIERTKDEVLKNINNLGQSWENVQPDIFESLIFIKVTFLFIA